MTDYIDSLFSELGDFNILEKLCEAFDNEYSTLAQEISDIVKLIDPDNCPESYLRYICSLLGEYPDNSWTAEQKRAFTKDIISFVKIKGTQHNINQRALLKGDDIGVKELYKSKVDETTDYSRNYDSIYYNYKSARIDLISCTKGCETIDETNVSYMTPLEAKEYIEGLGDVLPVNVRVRENFEVDNNTDYLNTADSMLTCLYCETACETICENSSEPESSIKYYPVESLTSVTDTVNFTTSCIISCETLCEDCCECWGYRVIPDKYGEIYGAGIGYMDVRLYTAIGGEDTGPSSCETNAEAAFGPVKSGEYDCLTTAQTDSIAIVGDYLYYLTYIQSFGIADGYDHYLYRFYLLTGEDLTDKYGEKEAVSWADTAEDCDGNSLSHTERTYACDYSCEANACQAYCEQYCELDPEVACSGGCQTACQGACQAVCQSACQAGFCQTGCVSACETAVQQDYLIVDGGTVS